MMKLYSKKSLLSVKVNRSQNNSAVSPREIPKMSGLFAVGIDCPRHGVPSNEPGLRSNEAIGLIREFAGTEGTDNLFVDMHESVCCGLVEDSDRPICCLETEKGNHYTAVIDGLTSFFDAAKRHEKRLSGNKVTLFFSYSGNGVHVDRKADHILKGVDLLAIPSQPNLMSDSEGVSYVSIATLQGILGGNGVEQVIYFLDCCRTRMAVTPPMWPPSEMAPNAMALFPVGIGVKLWEGRNGDGLLSRALRSVLGELRNVAGNDELSVGELRKRLEARCRSTIGVQDITNNGIICDGVFESSFEENQKIQDGKIIWKFCRGERLDVKIDVLVEDVVVITLLTHDSDGGTNEFRKINLTNELRRFELEDLPDRQFIILCYDVAGTLVGDPIPYNFFWSVDERETVL